MSWETFLFKGRKLSNLLMRELVQDTSIQNNPKDIKPVNYYYAIDLSFSSFSPLDQITWCNLLGENQWDFLYLYLFDAWIFHFSWNKHVLYLYFFTFNVKNNCLLFLLLGWLMRIPIEAINTNMKYNVSPLCQ